MSNVPPAYLQHSGLEYEAEPFVIALLFVLGRCFRDSGDRSLGAAIDTGRRGAVFQAS